MRVLSTLVSMYRIHGPDAPWTIGDAVSKGFTFKAKMCSTSIRAFLSARV